MSLKRYALGELLSYEQPAQYIVESTDYDDKYTIPVLTAGKSFILGYTNESSNVYNKLPVIIFDDFTTASQYVNFPFKVKSSAMKILTANTDLILPKYAFYRMQIIKIDHSTHKRYWIQQYSKIEISVPPLEEQRRIVSHIEELFSQLDASMATMQKVKEQLGVYKNAVLSEVFSSIPCDRFCPLDGYLLQIESGKSFKCEERPPKGNEYGIIKVSAVTWGEFNEEESKTCTTDQFNESKRIKSGDFLFSRANTIQLIGNCVITKNVTKNLMLSDKILRFVFKKEIIPDYVLYFLRSQHGRRQIQEFSTGNQESMRNISQDSIRKIMIPVVDYSEQKEIVDHIEERLSECENINRALETTMRIANTLRQSILKQVFEWRS